MLRSLPLILSLTILPGCLSTGDPVEGSQGSGAGEQPVLEVQFTFQPDLPISAPPFAEVHANWKQRVDQPYVYAEFTGSYTKTGRLLPLVQQALSDQGILPSGPPFVLFYDDPGQIPAERLRSRACVPVSTRVNVEGAIAFDLLPSTTVVYAFASGAYPEVPRVYPGMYRYMGESGWVENGPIRETYFVSPEGITSYDELLTEIQIPVSYAR